MSRPPVVAVAIAGLAALGTAGCESARSSGSRVDAVTALRPGTAP